MLNERQPFFRELRSERPVLELPEVTFVTRHADCTLVLHRFQDFGVDLYRPKQGDYFMAQDDTADHWRDKSVMQLGPRFRGGAGDARFRRQAHGRDPRFGGRLDRRAAAI